MARRNAFTLAKANSIGLKPGLQGGRKRNCAATVAAVIDAARLGQNALLC
jgi:hypothetical protein